MGISEEKKKEDCFRIFETVRREPLIQYDQLSERVGLSRNTVSLYVREMQSEKSMIGPYLHLKPSVNYPRYIQMATFSSPGKTFESFKEFPSISYHALCIGDWNFLFMTERAIDLSKLVGFSEACFYGRRGSVWDVPPQFCTWNDAFNHFQESLESVPRSKIPSARQVNIPWSEDEWKLYEIFKNNLRKKITPIVKKIKVRYETYTEWSKTLAQYTETITAYYPEGFPSQTLVYFLVETKKLAYVPSLFMYWPATTLFYRAGDKLLILLALQNREYMPKTLNLFEDLMSQGYISSYKYALLLQHWRHTRSQAGSERII